VPVPAHAHVADEHDDDDFGEFTGSSPVVEPTKARSDVAFSSTAPEIHPAAVLQPPASVSATIEDVNVKQLGQEDEDDWEADFQGASESQKAELPSSEDIFAGVALPSVEDAVLPSLDAEPPVEQIKTPQENVEEEEEEEEWGGFEEAGTFQQAPAMTDSADLTPKDSGAKDFEEKQETMQKNDRKLLSLRRWCCVLATCCDFILIFCFSVEIVFLSVKVALNEEMSYEQFVVLFFCFVGIFVVVLGQSRCGFQSAPMSPTTINMRKERSKQNCYASSASFCVLPASLRLLPLLAFVWRLANDLNWCNFVFFANFHPHKQRSCKSTLRACVTLNDSSKLPCVESLRFLLFMLNIELLND
jgi:hypothetical protein